MIDELYQRHAGRVAKSVSETTKSAVNGTGNALFNGLTAFASWFDSFRWIEFCTAITAATAVGLTMAGSLKLSEDAAQKVGAFGGIVTAIAFVRSPKTKWEPTKSEDEDEG